MYTTKHFSGKFADPKRINNLRGNELFEALRRDLTAALDEAGVPYRCTVDEVKSGGMFGSRNPILIITHPNPPTQFFELGFVVNDNVISFPLLGESKQNTKKNTKETLLAEGKYVKAALVNPDEFILEQEYAWEGEIMDAFRSILD